MSEDNQRRQTLAGFLRTRRARLSPAEVGLTTGSRRRTPGLRREEVATLANVGISWYTALEQGREIRPSESVLNSLAATLRLNSDERQHLFLLAGYLDPVLNAIPDETISPALKQVVQDLAPNLAYILGYRWDYLAWNEPANQLWKISQGLKPYPCNLVWQLFTNPYIHALYPDWEKVAQNVVGGFRAESEKYPGDPQLNELIGALQEVSPLFSRWWQQHKVLGSFERSKNINHPLAGPVLFEQITFQLAAQPALKLIVYTPTAQSAEKLNEIQSFSTFSKAR